MMNTLRTAVIIGSAVLVAIVFVPAAMAQLMTDMEPTGLAAADLDLDGNIDLVVGHNGARVCWYFGLGDGNFEAARCTPTNFGVTVRYVEVADINGDFFPDIVVGDFGGGGIRVLTNNGDGDRAIMFTSRGYTSSGSGSQPRALVIADFDMDGLPDVATANWDLQSVGFFKGNGDGTFNPVQPTPGVGRVHGIVAQDFDGDFILDIALADYGVGPARGQYNRNIKVLRGNGDGTFNPPMSFMTGLGPRLLASQDFNGDTCPDLASSNLGDDTVSVLLNACDGTGSFLKAVHIPTDPQAFGIAAGDLDLNGSVDLVISSNQVGTMSSLLGVGDGTFGDPTPRFTGGPKPRFVVLADINNDGYLDAMIANFGNDSIAVLLGAGDGTFMTPM